MYTLFELDDAAGAEDEVVEDEDSAAAGDCDRWARLFARSAAISAAVLPMPRTTTVWSANGFGLSQSFVSEKPYREHSAMM
jgi:hypothetical protein